jgi:hypothetical protein
MVDGNSRFSIIVTWYRFVVATSVAGYAERTTEVVTTNSITGIAGWSILAMTPLLLGAPTTRFSRARPWPTALGNYGKVPLKTTRESTSTGTRVRRVLIRSSRHTASSRMNDTRPHPSKSLLIDKKSKQHVHPLEQIMATQACPISRRYCCQNQKKDDREL